jgi:hypothetical protein
MIFVLYITRKLNIRGEFLVSKIKRKYPFVLDQPRKLPIPLPLSA